MSLEDVGWGIEPLCLTRFTGVLYDLQPFILFFFATHSDFVFATKAMAAEAESLNIDQDKAENMTQIAEDEKIVLAPAARRNKILRSVRIKNVQYHT